MGERRDEAEQAPMAPKAPRQAHYYRDDLPSRRTAPCAALHCTLDIASGCRHDDTSKRRWRCWPRISSFAVGFHGEKFLA